MGKNIFETGVTPQAGEDNVDHKIASARIVENNKKTGIHEISELDLEDLSLWSMEQLEFYADVIAVEIGKRRKKQ